MSLKNAKYLLGVDVGTTSLKAAVFDENGGLVRSATRDYTLLVAGDRVEFPPEEYWALFCSAFREVTEGITLSGLAVDTQCETMVLTDEEGQPLTNAIVWLDNRATAEAEEIKAAFGNKKVYEITGQPEITATWPAAKLLWVKKHLPEVFAKIGRVFLLEDYLLYRMTGEFVTEKTLQSSSLYLDIVNGVWWKEMLDFVGISSDKLPRLCESGVPVGSYLGVPVVTGAMDQVAGAIGAGVIGGNVVSEMTGTTMAIFAPDRPMPPYDPQSIVPCHLNFDGKYCLLTWTPTAGIALKWFKNQFCEQFGFKELDELAAKVQPGSDGLVFLPYLCGSTMPKYDPDVRGAFMGLTMEHTRAHAVRSILEAVACMLRENLEYLGVSCKQVRSMGGGATSPLWCQIKADMTGADIVTLKNKETACLGTAILAGVGVGIFSDVKAACSAFVKEDKVYHPDKADYTACYKNFKRAEAALFQGKEV